DEKNREFTGSVKIVNTDDPSDCCFIQVSVKTPQIMGIQYLFTRFLSQHPFLMDILQWLLSD
ncbi:MAG: hypothetical protein KKG04_06885, partial [Candidatus Thermoplasmatota archaeon]|nr:hypothetical protein [Candidatus Thermoplasmatota archaeon]